MAFDPLNTNIPGLSRTSWSATHERMSIAYILRQFDNPKQNFHLLRRHGSVVGFLDNYIKALDRRVIGFGGYSLMVDNERRAMKGHCQQLAQNIMDKVARDVVESAGKKSKSPDNKPLSLDDYNGEMPIEDYDLKFYSDFDLGIGEGEEF